MSPPAELLRTASRFLHRHEVSPARVAGISTALAVHVALGLAALLPMRAAPLVPGEEDVLQVVFVPSAGQGHKLVTPPPPTPPKPPRKSARKEPPKPPAAPQVAKVETPPTDDGDVPVESMLLGVTPSFDELATIELPQPDTPASEILSYRKAYQPAYPPEARAAGQGGWVTLRVLVDAEGLPLAFVLVKTTATQQLVDAAIEAIKKWRFNPALKDGGPVASWVEVPIGFWANGSPANAQASALR